MSQYRGKRVGVWKSGLVFPAIILAGLYVSGYLDKHPENLILFQIAFLAVSAPPAATVSQLAVMYDRDALEASVFNVMGVLFCVVTMPVMMYLLQVLFV